MFKQENGKVENIKVNNNNLSSGAGREAFEIEAKPKIVTISHVFVPILLLLLKYAKIDKQMTLM